jgi:hypothetical protein
MLWGVSCRWHIMQTNRSPSQCWFEYGCSTMYMDETRTTFCNLFCDQWRETGNRENAQGMVSVLITKTQEVADAAICREDYADSLLGRTRCILGALHATGEHYHLRPAVRSEWCDFWLEVSFCNMTMLGPMLLMQQLQQFRTCTLIVFHICHTYQT